MPKSGRVVLGNQNVPSGYIVWPPLDEWESEATNDQRMPNTSKKGHDFPQLPVIQSSSHSAANHYYSPIPRWRSRRRSWRWNPPPSATSASEATSSEWPSTPLDRQNLTPKHPSHADTRPWRLYEERAMARKWVSNSVYWCQKCVSNCVSRCAPEGEPHRMLILAISGPLPRRTSWMLQAVRTAKGHLDAIDWISMI